MERNVSFVPANIRQIKFKTIVGNRKKHVKTRELSVVSKMVWLKLSTTSTITGGIDKTLTKCSFKSKVDSS